ncbi:hypothetical protein BT96DRAFT_1022089 [Gymnopus androsaceus JB14]|uniref:Chitin synthase export chaperone n=1 Tax=Gymnopus androsaceus JB14 TaxID=1447944 RepID=A0A6A4HAX6_9AGAR|nr:hypothetical protein BT96DRAFT_1022089 [Gymnopus androsaceus JB14]
MLNRYLSPAIIIITLFAYFSDSWSSKRCIRYGSMETFQTLITTSLAQVFLTLRVYALCNKKYVCVVAGIIAALQWGIAIFVMSQSSSGTDQVAVLLPLHPPPVPLPELPDTDPFHVCLFISTLTLVPWVEAFVWLSLSFDALAFLAIIFITVKAASLHPLMHIMKVIQRDGIIYFFILFSSNFIWIMLLLHAKRPALQFIHNKPTMIVSCIMINRITLNLKRASYNCKIIEWSIKTFEDMPQAVPSRGFW